MTWCLTAELSQVIKRLCHTHIIHIKVYILVKDLYYIYYCCVCIINQHSSGKMKTTLPINTDFSFPLKPVRSVVSCIFTSHSRTVPNWSSAILTNYFSYKYLVLNDGNILYRNKSFYLPSWININIIQSNPMTNPQVSCLAGFSVTCKVQEFVLIPSLSVSTTV